MSDKYKMGGTMTSFTQSLLSCESSMYRAVGSLIKEGHEDTALCRELKDLAKKIDSINRRIQPAQFLEIDDSVSDGGFGVGGATSDARG